jgi:alkanesulfonate monooxygenase SsuD/methylene tetrahydromethanopterin reductase-like flavin-dependent oxidoreductase (luciferase family)
VERDQRADHEDHQRAGAEQRRGDREAHREARVVGILGDRDGAARAVPDALVAAVGVAGTPDECRERVEAYRRAGLALPIISPRVSGPGGKHAALAAIRACAPGRPAAGHS